MGLRAAASPFRIRLQVQRGKGWEGCSRLRLGVSVLVALCIGVVSVGGAHLHWALGSCLQAALAAGVGRTGQPMSSGPPKWEASSCTVQAASRASRSPALLESEEGQPPRDTLILKLGQWLLGGDKGVTLTGRGELL